MIRMDEKMEFYESFQRPNEAGYAVIGAGLPRTGTMSTRHALGVLLGGKCHHMLESVVSGTVHPSCFIRDRKQNFDIHKGQGLAICRTTRGKKDITSRLH